VRDLVSLAAQTDIAVSSRWVSHCAYLALSFMVLSRTNKQTPK
jgi:hypothetical protein